MGIDTDIIRPIIYKVALFFGGLLAFKMILNWIAEEIKEKRKKNRKK